VIKKVDFEIPSLSEQRQAEDLETALIGVSGVEHVEADIGRHIMSVHYETDLIDRSYLERIIDKVGYPIKNETR
jgi:copper chaperone CopZ